MTKKDIGVFKKTFLGEELFNRELKLKGSGLDFWKSWDYCEGEAGFLLLDSSILKRFEGGELFQEKGLPGESMEKEIAKKNEKIS